MASSPPTAALVSRNQSRRDPPQLGLLIIGGDTPSRKSLALALAPPHLVLVAPIGFETIRSYLLRRPDVVLMDQLLPIVDALHTATMLRALDVAGQPVPLIAITGKLPPSDRQRYLSAGFDQLLEKSIDRAALNVRIIEVWAGVTSRWLKEANLAVGGNMAHNSDDKPVIDIPSALVRLGDDHQLLADLIRFFFEDAFLLLAKIQQAAANSDLEQARRSAHSLKGLAANFSALPAVAALQAVETCPHENAAELPVLVRAADHEMARLAAALTEFSERTKGSAADAG
jgi:two-component system, sensor histidine kinase and response regulator